MFSLPLQRQPRNMIAVDAVHTCSGSAAKHAAQACVRATTAAHSKQSSGTGCCWQLPRAPSKSKRNATLGSTPRLAKPQATTPTAYSTVTIIAAAARSRATGCADQQSPTKSSEADRPLISSAHREQRRGQITTPRRGRTRLNCWARPKPSAPAAMPVQPHFPPKPHTSSKTLRKTPRIPGFLNHNRGQQSKALAACHMCSEAGQTLQQQLTMLLQQLHPQPPNWPHFDGRLRV